MSEPSPQHEYSVRFPDPAGSPAEVQVHATVDLPTRTITVALPDQTRATVDVVTARALHMLLGGAVYGSLHPTGPHPRLEKNTGTGWPADNARPDARPDARPEQ